MTSTGYASSPCCCSSPTTWRASSTWTRSSTSRAPSLSKGLSYFVEYLGPWHMPLLFFLAGASTWFALSHRSGRQYAGERFKRLFIPFIAFG